MKSTQYVLMLFLSIISAFLGGTVGVWFLMPPSVLAQDGPQKQTIEAERFVLKDAQGRMRAELGTSLSDHPVLWFYDEEGRTGTNVGWSSISFHEGQGAINSRGHISGSGARFSDLDGRELTLTPWTFAMSEDDGSVLGKNRVVIAGGDKPWIKITDDEGFQAALGSTGTVETRTGKTNQTSAASLILFGKDGTAIWSAP